MIGSEKYPGPAGDADGDADQGPARPQPRLAVRARRRRARGDRSSCAASARSSFAVGAYLPLSTTAPIFVGGVIRAFAERARRKAGAGAAKSHADDELGPGNLFATGLVAGGAVAGVVVAMLSAFDGPAKALAKIALENPLTNVLGAGGYQLLGLVFFATMSGILWRVARQKTA